MNQNFEDCLENQKLVPFSSGHKLASKELGTACNDLSEAKENYDRQRYKWSTVQAYYAMFHAARALVYSRDYREKSHYCLVVALRALFVDEDLMQIQTWRNLRDAKYLRESADYDDVFSQTDAESIIKRAESFIDEATSILDKDK